MAWMGITLLVIAITALLFGLHASFTSEGGAIGQVPVFAYALAFPILLTLSLCNFRLAGFAWAQFPGWMLAVTFPVLVVLSGFLILRFGDLGRRYHQRKQ